MSLATSQHSPELASSVGADDAPVRPRPALAAWTLCRREWVRFIRQGNRVFGALGQPLVFWALFSGLLGPSFNSGGAASASDTAKVSYAAYFFPGTLVLIVLFTAIFTTISIIEDRREGFLQSVLVAPLPRWSIVAGKVFGGALIALAHAAVFLVLGVILQAIGVLNLPLNLLTAVPAMLELFVVAVALTSLGLAIAWPMQSTQGYHAIMMVFLLPMWLLSGAFAPPEGSWLAWIIRLNPLTYCIALLRRTLYWGADPALRDAAVAGLPSAWLCVAVTLGFAAVMFILAWRVAAVRSSGDAI